MIRRRNAKKMDPGRIGNNRVLSLDGNWKLPLATARVGHRTPNGNNAKPLLVGNAHPTRPAADPAKGFPGTGLWTFENFDGGQLETARIKRMAP
jgi:hypothetical protein